MMNHQQIEFLTSRGWEVSDDDEGSVTIPTGDGSSVRFTNVQVFFDQLAAGQDPGQLVQNWMIKLMDTNPAYGTPGVLTVQVHKMFPEIG